MFYDMGTQQTSEKSSAQITSTAVSQAYKNGGIDEVTMLLRESFETNSSSTSKQTQALMEALAPEQAVQVFNRDNKRSVPYNTYPVVNHAFGKNKFDPNIWARSCFEHTLQKRSHTAIVRNFFTNNKFDEINKLLIQKQIQFDTKSVFETVLDKGLDEQVEAKATRILIAQGLTGGKSIHPLETPINMAIKNGKKQTIEKLLATTVSISPYDLANLLAGPPDLIDKAAQKGLLTDFTRPDYREVEKQLKKKDDGPNRKSILALVRHGVYPPPLKKRIYKAARRADVDIESTVVAATL